MAYDVADGYVLLFGGGNDVNDTSQLQDTWKFSKGAWGSISPVVSPSARESAAMAYDVADGYVVLFGGYYSTVSSPGSYVLHPLNDTWTYLRGNWTQVRPLVAPPACVGGGVPWNEAPKAVYDPSLHAVILFEIECDQTWSFSGGTWTNVTPASQPPLGYTSLAPDQSDHFVLVYAGHTAWSTENGAWTKLSNPKVSLGFTTRFLTTMSGCPPLGGTVIFGGLAYGYLINGYGAATFNDTFLFSKGTWSRIVTSASPPAAALGVAVYSPSEHRLVLFGGILSIGPGGTGAPFAVSSYTWELG